MPTENPKLPQDDLDDEAQGLSLLDEDEIAAMNDDSLVDEDRKFSGEDDDAQDDDDGDGDGAGGAGDDDDASAAAGAADGADQEGAAAAAGTDDVAAAAARAAAEAAAAAAPREAGAAEDGGEGKDGGAAPVAAPIRPWVAPAAAQEKIAAIDQAIDALDQRYDDGELSRAEYRAEERKLRDQREDLVYAKRSSEDRIAVYASTTVPAFLAEHTQYKPGTLLHQMLDKAVHDVQADMIRSGTGDPLSVEALQKAHERIQKELGITPQPKPKPQKERAADKLPARQPAPPSLGKVPSANIESTSTDRFAAIDRLKGEAQEEAIARLSEAEQEAYLAWAG